MRKNNDHKLWFKMGFDLLLCMVASCVLVSGVDADSVEEQNKAAIRRLIDEIYHKGNMAVFDEIVAENAVLHDNEETITELEMAKRRIRMITNMYRDVKITIQDVIAEGEMVAVRSTFEGIFIRNGRKLISPGLTMSRFKDGKIIEVWRAFDNASIFRQLGVT
ncbi:MAG: ester cyclase, partial [Desulfobacterales bacterium]|nr:ester cyclase [Desulfobacterales bacterium]